jgi:hypothetical protein
MIFHREQAEKELQSEGVPSDVAHYVAHRQFGNQTRMKEQSQEVVAFSFESVVQDVRYAIRQMQLSGVGETERLYGFGITAQYFHVLGL